MGHGPLLERLGHHGDVLAGLNDLALEESVEAAAQRLEVSLDARRVVPLRLRVGHLQ